MSHTTKIASVPIKSMTALRKAVENLQKAGIRCELQENVEPRMFYDKQLMKDKQSVDGKAPLVLKLRDSQYDVAFLKNEDGHFEPTYDTWNGHVSRLLGVVAEKGTDSRQAGIGRLLGQYTAEATKEVASQQGLWLESEKTLANGQVELLFNVPEQAQTVAY